MGRQGAGEGRPCHERSGEGGTVALRRGGRRSDATRQSWDRWSSTMPRAGGARLSGGHRRADPGRARLREVE
ncbi:Hypothetical protein CAP_5477 [Chondromyces apiculatus DSM 436]|uniref:Uncharacterized protein n=1 Tax=Chondromyces apiculatus DSM 436 TaxID=1192034 RepID=A0A017T2N5_9BACT|nr:Hypothetical protein CAP_5477 [Chondromyces apiculatus DSM 436]